MASRESERCHAARAWMKTNYGKSVMAPLTGVDTRAFAALVHVWDLWVRTRDDDVLDAAKVLLRCMSPSNRNVAVAAISFVADWSHELRARRWLVNRGVHGVSEELFVRRTEVMQ